MNESPTHILINTKNGTFVGLFHGKGTFISIYAFADILTGETYYLKLGKSIKISKMQGEDKEILVSITKNGYYKVWHNAREYFALMHNNVRITTRKVQKEVAKKYPEAFL